MHLLVKATRRGVFVPAAGERHLLGPVGRLHEAEGQEPTDPPLEALFGWLERQTERSTKHFGAYLSSRSFETSPCGLPSWEGAKDRGRLPHLLFLEQTHAEILNTINQTHT